MDNTIAKTRVPGCLFMVPNNGEGRKRIKLLLFGQKNFLRGGETETFVRETRVRLVRTMAMN